MSNKYLIVGPAWVGDMVMAQCLFKILKQANPNAIIDVLAPTWSLPLISRMPEVSNAIAMSIGHGVLNLKERYRIATLLRANQYDEAILLPNSFKSALIPWLARIPKRTGWRGEMRYGLLNDVRILDKNAYPLMIDRFIALGLPSNAAVLKNPPLPELLSTEAMQQQVLQKYQLHNSKPILALCPGAEFGPAKRWPEKYYAEVANQKIKEGWQVWILGSPNDRVCAEEIMQLTNQQCINLVGKTQLVEAVDLLALSTGVICNDSGLMHIAAALNKNLIAVYGPTSPSFTPPLNQNAHILQLNLSCQPCFKRECPLIHQNCMKQLMPEKVLHVMQQWNSSV